LWGNILKRPGSTNNYWSGGEFNQMTGKIYLSSGEVDYLGDANPATTGGGNGKLAILDPVSGTMIVSGKLTAKTADDNLGKPLPQAT